MNRAVFWDKDGTLIPDIPYNVDPKRITLYSDAGKSLSRLREAGFKLIVVSNQSGVAHGKFPEKALDAVWNRLTELLQPFEAQPDGFYYCPHHSMGRVEGYAVACSCRKPAPGLLVQAAQDHNLNLAESWMVGDILNDIEAGNQAGCKTILIDRGNETEWLINARRLPAARVPDIAGAVDYILMEKQELFLPTLNGLYAV